VKAARLLILGSVLAILHVAAANAAVSVSHFVTAGTVPVGGTFDVDVIAAYDGSPILTGIFVSAGWDPTELSLVSASDAPFNIFFGASGSLAKFSDPKSFANDPAGTIRTVQFGATPGQSGGAGEDTVITTLQFEVVSEGDGTAEIDVIFNSGDGLFGGAGPSEIFPPDAEVFGVTVNVPEPASAALAFSALGSVALIAGWRNRRR
jgi:hypothetical protein